VVDSGTGVDTGQLYLDLLKRCLTNVIYRDPPIPTPWLPSGEFDLDARVRGVDWPSQAHTMIGFRRLENLQRLAESVLADKIPGDFLEAGVARGGAMVFLRGVLRVHDVTDRTIWLADSFQGFPEPSPDELPEADTIYPQLAEDLARFEGVLGERAQSADELYRQFLRGTSEDEVRQTFERYGLLDDQVRFLPGWFADTLPSAPVRRLAILRADSDLYDSTQTTLEHLYPKVSPGGYVIIDDYHSVDECRRAVHDYLKSIDADHQRLEVVDECAVSWRKEA
jgi:Macrocin-O-methyltransferase (TylF)